MSAEKLDLDALVAQWPFPNPEEGPGDGPVCMGGDLSVGRLIAAYTQGYFPWYDEHTPILWWCPDPRFVLPVDEVRLPRSLVKECAKEGWEVRLDTAFEEIIASCAKVKRSGQRGTWILPETREAYTALHDKGIAHCVGAWWQGELVGGLYGVALGKAFFGESMFHRRSNASKVAFAALARRLAEWGYALIDCQQRTPLLESFGGRPIARVEFLARLREALNTPTMVGHWQG